MQRALDCAHADFLATRKHNLTGIQALPSKNTKP